MDGFSLGSRWICHVRHAWRAEKSIILMACVPRRSEFVLAASLP
jgi:hypothetical protein